MNDDEMNNEAGAPEPIDAEEFGPTVRKADGEHCRFCGADPGEAALGGSEYRAFWEIHESRAHKLERIVTAIGVRPIDEVVRAIATELL